MRSYLLLLTLSIVVMMLSVSAFGQGIYAPEGMNIPGAFNGWSNPPNVNAFAGIQKAGGTFVLDSTLVWRRYHTVIHVDAAGADAVGGTYDFLFTSGPSTNFYQNKWNPVTVTLDAPQSYGLNGGGTNDNVTITNGKYYTVNFRDNGYAATKGIWIETTNPPVNILTVTQNPLAGSVTAGTPVTVNIDQNTNDAAAEQNLLVRYTTDNFATSTVVAASFVSGSSYNATIPGQPAGTEVKYYVFTSKNASPSSDFDLYTINYNNNAGANYSYIIPAPSLTITASAGLNGSIVPSGAVVVSSGGTQTFNFNPDPGYYVDSIIVDNVYSGDSSHYTFTNVLVNHTIRVVFAHNVNVTFAVNMAQKIRAGDFRPDLGDTVSVNGTFNGWTSGADMLTAAPGDSIYRKVKALKVGLHHAYKFWKSVRGTGNEGWEDHVSDRQLDVGESDTTLPVPYFDNDAPPNPTVNVTFQVDMSIQIALGNFIPDSGDVVTVRGGFNGWGDLTNNPDTLHDPLHTGVYSKTIAISNANTYEYKFWKTTRNSLDYETIFNRSVTLGVTDTTLTAVFYNDVSSLQSIFSVTAGWNMISLPRLPADPRKTALFPGATSLAFSYSGTYTPQDSLKVGTGYWLKYAAERSDTVSGAPVSLDSIPVAAGWNMIGSLTSAIAISSIGQVPGGLVSSSYFGFNGSYVITDSILPGKAYWIKATQPGVLVMSGSSIVPKARGISTVSDYSIKLTIHDARGFTQTLYLGKALDAITLNRFELPPAPPEGSFDARFASNRTRETLQGSISRVLPILVTGSYPITIGWEQASGSAPVSLKFGKNEVTLEGSGSVRIADPRAPILVKSGKIVEKPKNYALHQNYPNPFNPTTTITYDLPAQSLVSISIYNELGQRVAVLADGVQEAGFQTVSWRSVNQDGFPVASGIYFYSMRATSTSEPNSSFTQVRKMMVVK